MAKERIDPRGVKRLRESLKENPEARKRAAGHVKRDFYKFVEQNFELDDEQRKELRTIPAPVAEGLGHSLAAVLEFDGDVRYSVDEGSPAIKYEVKYEYDSKTDSHKATASVSYSK